jgi:hypothetical protein
MNSIYEAFDLWWEKYYGAFGNLHHSRKEIALGAWFAGAGWQEKQNKGEEE